MRNTWEHKIYREKLIHQRKHRLKGRIRVVLIGILWIACFAIGIQSSIKPVLSDHIYENKYRSLQENMMASNSHYNQNRPLNGKTIVVDAGHGGADPGTSGVISGIYESEINLQIANLLSQELDKLGATVVMTRTDETTQRLGDSRKLFGGERKAIIENAEADMLLSIHQNFNEYSSSISGVQILVRHKDDIPFAEKLQDAFNLEMKTNLNYIQGEYALLNYGDQPGFIIECGFFSNPEEEALLQKPEHQRQIVRVLVNEVKNYLGS